LEKIPRNEKEWYYKTGFLAPTTGLKVISQMLEELGFKIKTIGQKLTKTTIELYFYQYR